MPRTQGVSQIERAQAGSAFQIVDVLLMKIVAACVQSVAERVLGDPLNQNYKRL
jgi:hypothetical protein